MRQLAPWLRSLIFFYFLSCSYILNGIVCVSTCANKWTCLCPLYNTFQNKERWNSTEVGQNLLRPFHRLVTVENGCIFKHVKWSTWCTYCVYVRVCVGLCVCGSNVGISRLIPIKSGVFCFHSLLNWVVAWLLKPISELLSHQWEETAWALALGRAAEAGGAGGDVVQAMRKAPLSWALAKSREKSAREREEFREEDKGRRSKNQSHDSLSILF